MDSISLCLYTWTDSLFPTVLAGHVVISPPYRWKKTVNGCPSSHKPEQERNLLIQICIPSPHCCTLENTGDQVTGAAVSSVGCALHI